jgi:hypothetical protein
MARVRITNKGDLKRWLQGIANEKLRRKYALAIATRAALRVLPVLGTRLRYNEEKAVSIILPAFHAIAASRLAAVGSSRNAEIISAAHAAADAAFFAAETFADVIVDALAVTRAARAARAARAVAFAVAFTANATAYAAVAVDVAAAAAHAAADAAADIATFIARAARAVAWEAVERDARMLEAGGQKAVSKLVNDTHLWPKGTPVWANKFWSFMKKRLREREGEHWEVWTKWYDARLDPSRRIPCYSPPIPELERARVLLPEDLWKQGPKAVNAEIKRLIAEYGCEADSPPPEPVELEGIRFEIDDEGKLDEKRQPPEPDELNDPVQQMLFRQLKQKVAQLVSHAAAIGNQYPEFSKVLRDYESELSVSSLQELDIPAVWMTGVGIVQQAEAFRRMDDSALTPRLEPEVEGLLGEVAELHGAFIMGFGRGRELVQRQLQARLSPEQLQQLKEAEERFLSLLVDKYQDIVTEVARQKLQHALDLLHLKAVRAEEVVGAALHVSVNALIAVSRALLPWITSGMAANALGADGLQAWLEFLQTNSGLVFSIAQHMPELRAYLRYLFDRADRQWTEPEDGKTVE